ncbi:hypothetical protein BB934_37425 (plasmid) [Microvirga ossetica]|uniref:DUF2946 domain-containing protein n=1 Tax=Microvirga ossetica TaxID=1882682 RepID=A0A1B2EVF1_9HYPH|nr:hypothetical protein [Microvirga ossetica]ANY83958.1 hypothetical protein BB934_37425 [Microvirga ossetica]
MGSLRHREPITRVSVSGMNPKDRAVACLRLMLRRLMVVLVASGLASVPWHAVAQTAPVRPSLSAHAVQVTLEVHSHTDHQHGTPSKSHASGQACCHPGCIMAVVPAFGSAAHALPLSESVPIPPDLTPVLAMLSGIDRPPKRA